MADTLSLSQIPGNPCFRNNAVNAVAVVPLLSSGRDGEIASHSAKSFQNLSQSLRRHKSLSNANNDLLLVVPNSSLTRPGDWRYNETPLKGFHWQNGCQRLRIFDGRPHHSRMAHDRLMNHSITRDWIDLIPSRRTAAVIGVLNLRDCKTLADMHRAEEELHQWANRYAVPPYEVTAHGRSSERDKPVERLFVFDSFHEDCQSIDVSKSTMGNSLLAFPPVDEAHVEMMDLHLNVVINDLAVAIFRSLEQKILESDAVCSLNTSINETQGPLARRSLTRIISGSGETSSSEDQMPAASRLNVNSLASFVSPDSKLAKDSRKAPTPTSSFSESRNFEAARQRATGSTGSVAKLLTPLDENFWEKNALSSRDLDAIRKREVSRREKWAADLSLLAGSPLDAYERYLKAAELCKTGTPDPLWYALALEGCAASHIAMAEAGGFGVDEYLENNFQMPDEVMALAKSSASTASTTKQTLPEVVFALCEEALNITNRHPKLGALHAELLMKMAFYVANEAEAHLRCRWGEGDGCYGGEADEVPRWDKPSVAKMKFGELRTKDGAGDMISINTLNRMKQACELMHEAVSVASIESATRVDLASRCAQICLKGVKATQWNQQSPNWVKLPRKAAFFSVVAAEAMSISKTESADKAARDLWTLATKLYTKNSNPSDQGGDYGWAALRAITLNALSVQGNNVVANTAAGQLLQLLSEIGTSEEAAVGKGSTHGPASKMQVPSENPTSSPQVITQNSAHGRQPVSEETTDVETTETVATASTFARQLRDSFSTMAAANASILTLQSKWADDDVIRPIDVPFAQSTSAFASVQTMGCVWFTLEMEKGANAQIRCINRISKLRKSLPTLSTTPAVVSEGSADTLPFFVSSAMTIHPEPALELECVRKKQAKVEGVMSTFFNPFEKKNKVQVSIVAEEEERAMSIEFTNKLCVPVTISRCQLLFNHTVEGRVKATPLSFTLPPKAVCFPVNFPFSVLSAPADSVDDERNNSYEVTGIRLTFLGRAFSLPLDSIGQKKSSRSGSSAEIPPPASSYPHLKLKEPSKETVAATKPRFEACPGQPRLQIHFAKSGVPVEADRPIPISLADGELFTFPSIKLSNYPGPTGHGTLEQLQIYAVDFPDLPDKKLFDSTESDSSDAGEKEFARPLLEDENAPPLKLRALASSFRLDEINGSNGTIVAFQIAAAHNMKKKLADKETIVKIRFRYRGPGTAAAEFWRRREMKLRVVYVSGPRISSIEFRPDLAEESEYLTLCGALDKRAPEKSSSRGQDKNDDLAESERNTEKSMEKPTFDSLLRVGMDRGVHVASDDVVFVLTVANETSSELTLTREGSPIGGFQGKPLDSMDVRPGVSAKFPVVLRRIPRLKPDGSSVDLVEELMERTKLAWNILREDDPLGRREMAKGQVRIPMECLRDIVEKYPSFVPRICESPCQIQLSANEKTVNVGCAVDASVNVSVASWIPKSVADSCKLIVEFFCAPLDASGADSAEKPLRDYVWAGKLRQRFNMSDSDIKHAVKIAFLTPGVYAISACVRISREDAKDAEEVWWAPRAQKVQVEKSMAQ